jgi:hypothetical protein
LLIPLSTLVSNFSNLLIISPSINSICWRSLEIPLSKVFVFVYDILSRDIFFYPAQKY